MKNKTALIIISPLVSHALPSFYLANLLEGSGYKVFYFSHIRKNLQTTIEANGFSFIQSKTTNIGYLAEIGHVTNTYRKRSFLYRLIKFMQIAVSAKLFKERAIEIEEVINNIKPSIVFIDVFSITNYLFFYPYRHLLSIFFISPMLSTHTQKGFPILSDKEWIKDNSYEKRREKEHPLKNTYSPLYLFFDKLIMKSRCRRVGLRPENAMVFNRNYFTLYQFKNVPELVLAPLELEVSEAIKQANQYYLGLCINPASQIADVDAQFNIEDIINMKADGSKIILCSFGTYFNNYDQHRIITRFITNVIESVIDRNDVHLIIASNNVVLDVIKKTIPDYPHIHLFSKVPQREVLAHADAFITHGGLGSIKEGIAYGVPMLVYPLDHTWDNNGNAFKIYYHQLGMRGEMAKDDINGLKQQISEILYNPQYHNNITALRHKLYNKYTPEFAYNTIMNLCKPC